MGIIDTLSEGLGLAAKKPYLLSVPVALDLFLLLGPKVSIAPFVESTIQDVRQLLLATGGQGMDASAGVTLDLMMDELGHALASVNLLGMLAWTRAGLPSIGALRPIIPERDWVVQVGSLGELLLLQVLLLALGLFIACVFLGMLGQEARGEQLNLGLLVQRVPTYWLRFAVLLIPMLAALTMAMALSALILPLAFLIWAMLLWAVLFLYFVPAALFLGEEGPLSALWMSILVVRSSFWSALGLVLLVIVISSGLSLLWQPLLSSTLGSAIAMLANAYVGTGMTLAAFVFYRDRVAALRGERSA